jgi:hypothetical protein
VGNSPMKSKACCLSQLDREGGGKERERRDSNPRPPA